jgi:hypothetical protein
MTLFPASHRRGVPTIAAEGVHPAAPFDFQHQCPRS